LTVNAHLRSCAILFAIPTDRSEFNRAAAARSDYMAGLLVERDAGTAWAADYENVALAAQRLMETAGDLKVNVCRAAGLQEFASATGSFETVVLFAHWRGAIFRREDFRAPLSEVLDRMSTLPPLRRASTECSDWAEVVDHLNAAVDGFELLKCLPPSIITAATNSHAIRQTLCRDIIDEVFSGLAAPGNRIELFDGLHSMAEMESALSPGFSGTLDLALCNSEAFAVFLDLRRRNQIRHLHWPVQVLPLPQILKVEWTLGVMAIEGGGYVETRLRIEEGEARGLKSMRQQRFSRDRISKKKHEDR